MMTFMCGMPCLVFAQDQRVTIHVTNVDIQVVFKQIKEQANLNFVYNADQLKEMKSVTLNVNNVTVNSVLKTLFDDTPFEYKFEMSSIVIRQKKATSSQVDKNIKKSAMLKGKVVDNRDKKPIPGVTVVVKGTSVGVVTNIDGCFSLMIPDTTEHAELVFSFVGMKSRVIPYSSYRNIGELIVSLEEDLLEMDEVVVTAKANINEIDIRARSGVVQEVDMRRINSKPMIDMGLALQGSVPGLIVTNTGELGSAPEIRIRGNSSLRRGNTTNEPLYVMDGKVISSETFYNLNPQDIKEIKVLKDAAACALYGIKAANGVLEITSQRGISGQTMVTYTLDMGITTRGRRGISMMNSVEKLELERRLQNIEQSLQK